MEESKNIDMTFAKIWKYLFKSFKLFNVALIFSLIEKQLAKDKYCHDKLAIEIMSGMIRASPSLDYNDLYSVTNFLSKIVDKHLTNFNSESFSLWKYFVMSFFDNRDIRRSLWLFERLLSMLFHESTFAYYQAAYLKFLAPVYKDNWKFPQVSKNVLSILEKNLNFPYHNVRMAIAK